MTSQWRGSITTMGNVAHQIEERFGKEAVKKYDPQKNCFTLKRWNEMGYKVKKGEKCLRSVTLIEKKDANGNVTEKYPRNVSLFFETQVEKLPKK